MELAGLAEKSAKYVGKKGKTVGRRGMKGAKHLGSSVKNVLVGATGNHRTSQKETVRHSAFFHEGFEDFHGGGGLVDAKGRKTKGLSSLPEHNQSRRQPRRSSFSNVPVSDLERLWSTRPGDDDESDNSSLYHSSDSESDNSSTSSEGSVLISSFRPGQKDLDSSFATARTKGLDSSFKTEKSKDLDTSNRTEKKKEKKMKEKREEDKPRSVPKRIDFTGQIHEESTDDDSSKKKKKEKVKKKRSKKSKKEKNERKTKKKPRREITKARSEGGLVLDDDSVGGTKVEIVKPARPAEVKSGAATVPSSANPVDPAFVGFLSFVDEKDRARAASRVQRAVDEKLEAMVREKKTLKAKLDEETQRNKELKEKIKKMEKEEKVQEKSDHEDELRKLCSEVERLQLALSYEREAAEAQGTESREKIQALEATVKELKWNELHARRISAATPVEDKANGEKLQGELEKANARIADLERTNNLQDIELNDMKKELATAKDNVGVQLLQERLKASQEQERTLRNELDHIESDWTERLKSKEETIEFFLKEVSRLKLLQATGTNRMGSGRITAAELEDVLDINQGKTPARPKLEKKTSNFSFWRLT